MKPGHLLLIVFAAIAMALTVVIARIPYFAADVTLAKALQAALPQQTAWAEWVTATAKWPWLMVLMGLSGLIAGFLAGVRALLLAPVSLALMWLLDKGLRMLVFQPRPSPDLIHVAVAPLPGSAFPSTFALMFAGTFGYLVVVAIARSKGTASLLVAAVGTGSLMIGFAARVALGAHWPSDVLVSYLYGFVIAAGLVAFIPRRRR